VGKLFVAVEALKEKRPHDYWTSADAKLLAMVV